MHLRLVTSACVIGACALGLAMACAAPKGVRRVKVQLQGSPNRPVPKFLLNSLLSAQQEGLKPCTPEPRQDELRTLPPNSPLQYLDASKQSDRNERDAHVNGLAPTRAARDARAVDPAPPRGNGAVQPVDAALAPRANARATVVRPLPDLKNESTGKNDRQPKRP